MVSCLIQRYHVRDRFWKQSALETEYFVVSILLNSSKLLRSFKGANLLVAAAGGSFLVSRRVKLMVQDLLCCLPAQEGQQGC